MRNKINCLIRDLTIFQREYESGTLDGTERERVDKFLADVFNRLSDIEDKTSTADCAFQTLIDDAGLLHNQVEKIEEVVTSLKDDVEGFDFRTGGEK